MKKRLVVGFFLFFLTGSMLASRIASPQEYPPVDPLPPSKGPVTTLSESPLKGVNKTTSGIITSGIEGRPRSPITSEIRTLEGRPRSPISFEDKIKAQIARYKAQLKSIENRLKSTDAIKSVALERELQQMRMKLKFTEDFLKNPQWWTPPLIPILIDRIIPDIEGKPRSPISFEYKIKAQIARYKAQLKSIENRLKSTDAIRSVALERELKQIEMKLKFTEDFLKNPQWWTPPLLPVPGYGKCPTFNTCPRGIVNFIK